MPYPKRRKRKPMGMRSKQRNLRHPQHLAFVRGHQCSVDGCNEEPIEAAHFDGPIPNAERGGMSVKDHDKWAFPLCNHHHGEQHSAKVGWAEFDRRHGIDCKAIAERLASISPHRHRWDVTETLNAG